MASTKILKKALKDYILRQEKIHDVRREANNARVHAKRAIAKLRIGDATEGEALLRVAEETVHNSLNKNAENSSVEN